MVRAEEKSQSATAAAVISSADVKAATNSTTSTLNIPTHAPEEREIRNDEEATKDRDVSSGEEREKDPRLVKEERKLIKVRKQNRSTPSGVDKEPCSVNVAANSNKSARAKTTKKANPKTKTVAQLIAKALEASLSATILKEKEKAMREAKARRKRIEQIAQEKEEARRKQAAEKKAAEAEAKRVEEEKEAMRRLEAVEKLGAERAREAMISEALVAATSEGRSSSAECSQVMGNKREEAERRRQCIKNLRAKKKGIGVPTDQIKRSTSTTPRSLGRASASEVMEQGTGLPIMLGAPLQDHENIATVPTSNLSAAGAGEQEEARRHEAAENLAEQADAESIGKEKEEARRKEEDEKGATEADATTVAKNMATAEDKEKCIADVDTVIGRAAEKATAEIKAIRRKRVVAAAKLAIASAEAKKLMAQAEQEAAEKKAAAEAEAKRIKEVEEEARRQEAEEEMAAEAEANEQMEPVRPTQEVPSLTPEPPSPTNAPLTPTTDNSKPQNERKVSANSTVWFKLSADMSKLPSDDAFFVEQWKQALSAPKTQASSTLDDMAKAGHVTLREASVYNMYCSDLKQKFRSDALFVQGLINELIRFLALKIFVYGLPHPSPDIEKAWSTLMLFPQTYAEVCNAMGSPEAISFHTASVTNLTRDAKKERYSLTLSTYSVLFNEEPPSEIWWSVMDDNADKSSRSSSDLGMSLRWKTPGHTGDNVTIQDDFSSDDNSTTSTRDGTLTADTDDYTISLPMFSIKLSANKDKIIDLGSKVAEWADWFDSPPAQKR